ncbi:MAG: hypothetical protein RL236_1884 [Pseudomonadota bacterium]|jgi:hypothetical protein
MQQQVCQKHEIPMTFSLPDDTNNFLAGHVALMANSFEQLFGRTIADVTGNESMVKKFYHAPFALLSHNTKAETIFNYANAKALELFELSWEEFITFICGILEPRGVCNAIGTSYSAWFY